VPPHRMPETAAMGRVGEFAFEFSPEPKSPLEKVDNTNTGRTFTRKETPKGDTG